MRWLRLGAPILVFLLCLVVLSAVDLEPFDNCGTVGPVDGNLVGAKRVSWPPAATECRVLIDGDVETVTPGRVPGGYLVLRLIP